MATVDGALRNLAWTLVVAIATSCSSGDADQTGDKPRGSGTPSSGAHAGASSGSSGKNGADNEDGDGFGNSDGGNVVRPRPDGGPVLQHDAGDSDAALTEDNACGRGMVMAKLKPVNMFVMFDRSQSMNDNAKWPNATAALSSFFQNPGADGLRVALRFFPHDLPAMGCTRDGCDAVACSQPLVPIGTLSAEPAPADAQEDALVNAIMTSAPGTGGGQGTPIFAALDGSLRWATDYQTMHTDETTVVIFVTDGEPNGCDEDFTNISRLASDALALNAISTYAIGLEGSSMAQMDQLAAAGGTTQGIYIGNSANAEQELLAALTAIRGETLTCDFPLPEPSDPSMMIDPTRVNVTFTPGSGSAVTLGQVPDDGSCNTAKAWHYDDPSAPTRIVLCPAACDYVRAEPDALLQVLLGCGTVCGGLDVTCKDPPPPGVPPVLI